MPHDFTQSRFCTILVHKRSGRYKAYSPKPERFYFKICPYGFSFKQVILYKIFLIHKATGQKVADIVAAAGDTQIIFQDGAGVRGIVPPVIICAVSEAKSGIQGLVNLSRKVESRIRFCKIGCQISVSPECIGNPLQKLLTVQWPDINSGLL